MENRCSNWDVSRFLHVPSLRWVLVQYFPTCLLGKTLILLKMNRFVRHLRFHSTMEPSYSSPPKWVVIYWLWEIIMARNKHLFTRDIIPRLFTTLQKHLHPNERLFPRRILFGLQYLVVKYIYAVGSLYL